METDNSSSIKRLRELASISEISPNPIIELDQWGTLVYCNHAAVRLFPDIREQSKNHEFLFGIDSALNILLSAGASVSRDIRVGDEWYHQTIHRAGEESSVRVYAVDITERKRVEFSRERFLTAVTKCKD